MIRFSPKAVTFDCAGTLLNVRWNPYTAASECARMLGIDLSPEVGSDFGRLFQASRKEYEAASLTRDPDLLHEYWVALHAAWLERHDLGVERAEELVLIAEDLAYGPNSPWFLPYPDAAPCLDRLRVAGIRLAVVSNWDSSLGRILRLRGLAEYFEVIIASLEEGLEKPEPALFLLATDRLGVAPAETIHVGDVQVDDVHGARSAGLRAIWLDRGGRLGPQVTTPRPGTALSGRHDHPATPRRIYGGSEAGEAGKITSLDELPGAFAWSE